VVLFFGGGFGHRWSCLLMVVVLLLLPSFLRLFFRFDKQTARLEGLIYLLFWREFSTWIVFCFGSQCIHHFLWRLIQHSFFAIWFNTHTRVCWIVSVVCVFLLRFSLDHFCCILNYLYTHLDWRVIWPDLIDIAQYFVFFYFNLSRVL
jgi:hypothetical protein